MQFRFCSNDRHFLLFVQFDNDFILENPKGCNYYSKKHRRCCSPEDCSIIISALRAFWFRGSLPGCFSRSARILSNNTLAGSSIGPFNAIPVLF
jgi:hypothetical protein